LSRLHGRGFASETEVASSTGASSRPQQSIVIIAIIAIIVFFIVISPLVGALLLFAHQFLVFCTPYILLRAHRDLRLRKTHP
jgi:hypothetical protein